MNEQRGTVYRQNGCEEMSEEKRGIYTVGYTFGGKVQFVIVFFGEEGLTEKDLDEILREQAAIIKGERKGVRKKIKREVLFGSTSSKFAF